MKKILLLFLTFTIVFVSKLNADVYAVIVGVEIYDGTVNNLSASVDDAERVYKFFSNITKSENLVILKDKQATKENILYEMDKIFSKAKEDDLVIFYYSGHGAPGLFCPHNINGGASGLRHSEIRAAFKKSKAKTKLCLADACYSGSIVGSKSNTSTTHVTSPGADNVIIFMSSRDSETSLESVNQVTGYFTKHLLLGLSGRADTNSDGVVNAYELYAYVRRNVKNDSQGGQTPVMFGNFDQYLPILKYKK
jgi:uncharacterized caspase-like protein